MRLLTHYNDSFELARIKTHEQTLSIVQATTRAASNIFGTIIIAVPISRF